MFWESVVLWESHSAAARLRLLCHVADRWHETTSTERLPTSVALPHSPVPRTTWGQVTCRIHHYLEQPEVFWFHCFFASATQPCRFRDNGLFICSFCSFVCLLISCYHDISCMVWRHPIHIDAGTLNSVFLYWSVFIWTRISRFFVYFSLAICSWLMHFLEIRVPCGPGAFPPLIPSLPHFPTFYSIFRYLFFYFSLFPFITPLMRWRGGITGRVLDLQSTGLGFKSYSGQSCVTTLGKLFTLMCLCHQAV